LKIAVRKYEKLANSRFFPNSPPRYENWKKPEGSKQFSFESSPLFFPAKRGVGVGASLASALRPPPDGEKP